MNPLETTNRRKSEKHYIVIEKTKRNQESQKYAYVKKEQIEALKIKIGSAQKYRNDGFKRMNL